VKRRSGRVCLYFTTIMGCVSRYSGARFEQSFINASNPGLQANTSMLGLGFAYHPDPWHSPKSCDTMGGVT
jgi:hypothetical protein